MLQRTRAADVGQRILTFSLPLEWAGRASVVGNFNDWTPGVLPLEAVGDTAEASVMLPENYNAVFRYLGDGDHWFDEPQADFIDGGGSVVMGVEPDEVAFAVAGSGTGEEPARVATAEPAASEQRLPSAAERSVTVTEKNRLKAEQRAGRAADKARKKASDLTAKVAKAADKQRKAAERVAREAQRQAKKAAEKVQKKSKKK